MHWLRRLVLAPAVIGLTVVLLATVPLWLIVAAFLSPVVPGRLRPLRLLWMLTVHVVLESVILVEMFGLWIASGFGWAIRRPFFERIHYDLIGAYLQVMFGEARRVLRLSVDVRGPAPDAFPGEPLLVCCRHAGPGDSVILMHALVNWYLREPRVVLKDTMAWDPAIGILLHRLPSSFISPAPGDRGDAVEAEIAKLATDLDANDGFVSFPEGGNFTPRRRLRAIESLRRRGHEGMAARAEGLRHVLAPKPGGVLAAMDAAPDADILMVAHTGLDHMLTVADVWRELPMDKTITMQWWRVPREEIPSGRDAQIDWLFGWWERIDDWVDAHR
ncbi:MAG: 1-acyl-sn-glycerol-3-phosphate acyltransferase [Thermocrispum sp.]